MAGDADSEMKNVSVAGSLNIDNYRKLVQTYINLHIYDAAIFWADKVVALTSESAKDVYWLAQCMYLLKQYHRAAHLLRSKNLDKTYILCNYLTVRCLLEANELNEALKVLNSMDMEIFLQTTCDGSSYKPVIEAAMFDDTPKHQIQSSVLLLKGQILEAMDNRGLAADCYKQALQCDVYCYEAFDCLIKHHMLSATEELQLLNSLPVSQQCSPEEAEILTILYRSKIKKYHAVITQDFQACTTNYTTPQRGSMSFQETPSLPFEATIEMNINSENIILTRLQNSLDLTVAQAEKYYYNCDYVQCNRLTENVLKEDPYHSGCLPIHISCLVELKQSNKLFTLAHNLVDLYPNLAISWFAVGCYYFVTGNVGINTCRSILSTIRKRDSARRYLSKATTLDRLFGPAWLAFGHSFAVENEHDQAMAAYFKASQLMRGCHLPLLYIGLECGLTNNIRLAEKFFQQAQEIAPDDPYVMHEMGVIAFQNLDYKTAEKHFSDALSRVRPKKTMMVSDRWEPLLNNMAHCCRKLKKYQEALQYHHEALILVPQSPSTYSAIAYVQSLMGNVQEAVEWFHKALGLRRDDTFSTTMLNYVIEQMAVEQPPFPGAPDHIPAFNPIPRADIDNSSMQDTDYSLCSRQNVTNVNMSDMIIEVDMSDVNVDKTE